MQLEAMRGMRRGGSPCGPVPILALVVFLMIAPSDLVADERLPMQLVESWPVETELDHPDIPDASDIWPSLIDGAAKSLDFAQFYLSDDPAGGGLLRPIIEAIEEAARRGVTIRFLSENAFYATYPEILDRLAGTPGIQVRRLDSAAFDGGVLHAKYFIVDGDAAYIGSQNFDWRSFEHIQELGAVITDSPYVREIQKVYDLDWEIAGLVPPGSYTRGAARGVVDSLVAARRSPAETGAARAMDRNSDSSTCWIRPAFSPEGRLPDDNLRDEPQIVQLIDSAREKVRLQLLTYNPVGRDGDYYQELENALRRAAARGATVQLLLADWCRRSYIIPYLKSLALVPGFEVRLFSVPEWSGGFIPYARVIHAKYLVVDGARFWLGTSNWEKSYFHTGRNVGIVGGGGDTGAQLDRFFQTGWDSPHAETVRPEIEYDPPRIGE